MIRIPLLGLTPALVRRYGPGAINNVRYTRGPLLEEVTFYASIQPLKANELMILPEGERKSDSYKCFTYTNIDTSDQYANTSANEIVWNGVLYKVTKAPQWNQLTGHYEFVMTRRQEGTV